MAVNEVPVAASFNTIVPAAAPAPVPKVKVWAPKFGLIFVPSMAAEAFTSAFTITPGAMAVTLPEEVTSPVRLALVTTVVALPVLVTMPIRFALVVTVAALPPIFKFMTGVVEVTTNGAVPVAIVEVNCVPETVEVAATEAGVMAPRVKVMAGVVVAVATDPLTPLAVTTDAEVTVPPVPVAVRVVPDKLSPLPNDNSWTGVVVEELPSSLLVALTACILA